MSKSKTVVGLVLMFMVSIVIDTALAAGGHGGSHGGRAAHGGHGTHGSRAWHGGGRRHGWYGGHHYRGSRWSYGIHFGAPWFPYYPEPYYYPPYYYPPSAAVLADPPVYIERGDTQESPAQANRWYYCAEADAYYPYVRECPGGWVQVSPQPPSN